MLGLVGGGMRNRLHEDLLGHPQLPHGLRGHGHGHLHDGLRPRRGDDGPQYEDLRRSVTARAREIAFKVQ